MERKDDIRNVLKKKFKLDKYHMFNDYQEMVN